MSTTAIDTFMSTLVSIHTSLIGFMELSEEMTASTESLSVEEKVGNKLTGANENNNIS